MLWNHVLCFVGNLGHDGRHCLQNSRRNILELRRCPKAVGQLLRFHVLCFVGDLGHNGWHRLQNSRRNIFELRRCPQAVGQCLWDHAFHLGRHRLDQCNEELGRDTEPIRQPRNAPQDIGRSLSIQLALQRHVFNSGMQPEKHRVLPIPFLDAFPSFQGDKLGVGS